MRMNKAGLKMEGFKAYGEHQPLGALAHIGPVLGGGDSEARR